MAFGVGVSIAKGLVQALIHRRLFLSLLLQCFSLSSLPIHCDALFVSTLLLFRIFSPYLSPFSHKTGHANYTRGEKESIWGRRLLLSFPDLFAAALWIREQAFRTGTETEQCSQHYFLPWLFKPPTSFPCLEVGRSTLLVTDAPRAAIASMQLLVMISSAREEEGTYQRGDIIQIKALCAKGS